MTCDYISMLRLKLNHASKRGHCRAPHISHSLPDGPRLDISKNFHLPDFPKCCIFRCRSYDLKENSTQIHLPEWQFYLRKAIGQWGMPSPVAQAACYLVLSTSLKWRGQDLNVISKFMWWMTKQLCKLIWKKFSVIYNVLKNEVFWNLQLKKIGYIGACLNLNSRNW